MSELPALLKRLETVTSRLEDLASKGSSGISGSSAANGSANGSTSASIEAFDEFLSVFLKPFVDLSSKIGGVVSEQAHLVQNAFEVQKQFLLTASKSKKPDASQLPALLKPTSDLLVKIGDFKNANRTSPLINHLSTVSEGAPALGWVAVEPKPAPYVEEMKNAAQFYSNRILKEFKEKDKQHVEWANSFVALLTELQAYIKKYHTTGVAWNPSGAVASVSAAAPSPAPAASSTPANNDASRPNANLFSALNKGGDITSGLKKVDKSLMTHKNPNLRSSSVVKAADEAPAPVSQTARTSAPKKPAKLALEGNRWCIENQENNKEIVLTDVDPKHLIYVGNCNNSTVQIKGKANAVMLDGCKKTAVVVENLVSSFDLVNCKSMQCQITGKVPTMTIDKTDGCIVYLSKTCLDIEIFTSKTSEFNISIPGKTENDDFVEMPVAEQFKTVVNNGGLFTVPVEHKDPSTKSFSKDNELKQLQIQNAFLEKEIESYRKETFSNSKKQEDNERNLLSEKTQLLQTIKFLEEKLQNLTKDKISFETETQQLKFKLKQAESSFEKQEKEFDKEKKRFVTSEASLLDKIKLLKKEKIDLENSQNVLNNKIKNLELQLSKRKKEVELSRASPQSKQNIYTKITNYENTIASLERKIMSMEESIDDLEKQNTLLEMQVSRFETSHSYAIQLEKDLDELNHLRSKLKEEQELNLQLSKMITTKGTTKSFIESIDSEINEMSKKFSTIKNLEKSVESLHIIKEE